MTATRRLLPNPALAAAIAMLIGCAHAGGALAQDSELGDDYDDKPRTSTGQGTAAGASERARQRKAAAAEQAAAPAQAPAYPNATRTEPSSKKYSPKEGKAAGAIQADYDAKKHAEVIAKADAFVAESTNAYMLSYVYQLAANAAIESGDKAKGVQYYTKALEANGLDNNGHFHIMYNQAVTLSQIDRNADALALIDRFIAETKTDKPEPLSLKAYLLSQLDRPAEGAAVYEQLLALKPNDRTTLMNAVALYQQADQFDKANALLESARKQGLLTEDKEYRALFVGYVNASKHKEAQEVLEDGVAKGVIKPSQTLANDYSILAQTYYAEEKTALAIDLYTRAAKAATDGEASLNLAKVLRNEDRIAEAKAAAREALAKGVKKPKDANDIIALPGGK